MKVEREENQGHEAARCQTCSLRDRQPNQRAKPKGISQKLADWPCECGARPITTSRASPPALGRTYAVTSIESRAGVPPRETLLQVTSAVLRNRVVSRVAHYAALLLYMRHVERSAFVRALMFARARPVSSCSLPQITSLDYCFSSVTLHILTGLSTLFSSLVTCVEPSSPPSHFSITSGSYP